MARQPASSVIAFAPPWVRGAGLPFYAALFSTSITPLRLVRPWWPRLANSTTFTGLYVEQSRTPPQIDPDDVATLIASWSGFPLYRVGIRGRLAGTGFRDTTTIDQRRVTLVWGARAAVRADPTSFLRNAPDDV
jgi:hypothetical protein